MNHILLRSALVVGAVAGLGAAASQLASSNAASGGMVSGGTAADVTATVGEDGTVAVTDITLPGQSVTVPADCEAAANQTAKVVCTAEAFLATLTDEQQTEAVLPMTKENAVVWSNLPTTFVPRNGLELNTLSDAQHEAALAVVKAAMGSLSNEGYNEAMQILMADDILNASGGMQNGVMSGGPGGPPDGMSGGMGMGGPPSGGGDGGPPPGLNGSGGAGGFSGGNGDYSSDHYFLAFLGTPSTTDTWILQFGGHHLAVNTTYKGGEVASATPKFTGVEPKVWTTGSTTYAPLKGEHDGMVAMLASLSDEELATANLSQTFSDVLVGPGEDGQFPETKAGLEVGSLSDEQKTLVLDAMRPWVQDADDATAEELLATYEDELNDTYIAFSGDATLSNHSDYVRIDGPSVWIEFVCQDGIVYSSQIHYHTIWRDHARDYGAEFSF